MTQHLVMSPTLHDRMRRYYDVEFGRRLGRTCAELEKRDPFALMSRASQIARTWRSYLGWLLAKELGW